MWPVKIRHRSTSRMKWMNLHEDEPAVQGSVQEAMANSWEICHRCAKILLAAEHKMQLVHYLRNTNWSQRCSEFGFFDEPFIILFTIY